MFTNSSLYSYDEGVAKNNDIEIYYKISQKQKFKEWLSTLYYGAKKEFSNLNGPFIKIY